MSRAEVENTLYGEFLDLLSCLSIYEGTAKQKREKIIDFDDALKLR